MPSNTEIATNLAILSSSLYTRLGVSLVADDRLSLVIDPWVLPGGDAEGYPVTGSIGADVEIVFHAHAGRRTAYLVLDETTAPLTGSYVVEIQAVAITYDATASAPADVPALLDGIKAALEADGTIAAAVEITKVKVKNPAGAYDALRIQALPSAAVAATGTPAGASYATFAIGASTSFPAGAALVVYREVESASAQLFVRAGYDRSARISNFNTPIAGLVGAWAYAADFGAIDTSGKSDRIDAAARSSARIWLHSPVVADEALTVVTSGAGIYAVQNVALAVIAGSVLP